MRGLLALLTLRWSKKVRSQHHAQVDLFADLPKREKLASILPDQGLLLTSAYRIQGISGVSHCMFCLLVNMPEMSANKIHARQYVKKVMNKNHEQERYFLIFDFFLIFF